MQQASKPCSKIVNFRTKNFALAIHDPTVLVLYEFQCIQLSVFCTNLRWDGNLTEKALWQASGTRRKQ